MRTFLLDLKDPINSTRLARVAEKRGVTVDEAVRIFFAEKVAPYLEGIPEGNRPKKTEKGAVHAAM